MTRYLPILAIAGLSAVTLSACGALPVAQPASTAAALGSNVVVADTGLGGDRTAVINLLSPQDGGFQTQSIVHRWVNADVTEYVVTLSAGTTVLSTVSVLPQSGQSKAVFSHLKLGTTYTVSVVAKGSNKFVNGGATQVINALTATSGTILFSGTQDVENAQTLNLRVQLDNVTFDGSATASILPTDGSYLTPTASESGAAN